MCANSGISEERGKTKGWGQSQEKQQGESLEFGFSLEFPERRDPRVFLGMKQGHIFIGRKLVSVVCSILL